MLRSFGASMGWRRNKAILAASRPPGQVLEREDRGVALHHRDHARGEIFQQIDLSNPSCQDGDSDRGRKTTGG